LLVLIDSHQVHDNHHHNQQQAATTRQHRRSSLAASIFNVRTLLMSIQTHFNSPDRNSKPQKLRRLIFTNGTGGAHND
jgi:hypothetical protein